MVMNSLANTGERVVEVVCLFWSSQISNTMWGEANNWHLPFDLATSSGDAYTVNTLYVLSLTEHS